MTNVTSLGDLKVIKYGNVEMIADLVKLNSDDISLGSLSFKSINVTENMNVTNTVNGLVLLHVERNALKVKI